MLSGRYVDQQGTCQGPKSTTDHRCLVSPSFEVRIPTIGYWLHPTTVTRLLLLHNGYFTTVTSQRLLDYSYLTTVTRRRLLEYTQVTQLCYRTRGLLGYIDGLVEPRNKDKRRRLEIIVGP
jgi:hypothetical protein